MRCPKCGFESPADMKFCGMCGTSLTRACPRCGCSNPLFYKFCGTCGVSLPQVLENDSNLLEYPYPPLDGQLSFLPEASPETTAQIGLVGERRIITVIVTDVTGSTHLLEEVGNETWVDLMSRMLNLQEQEIYRFGGKVDQFRGDGLLAFFGATEMYEDDPERALLAALAMQRAVQQFAASLKDKGIDLRLRVGINTGEVIVGSLGEPGQYQEDTAMGMAIAIAARMESSAEPGTILVSDYTYRLVPSQFEWLSLGKISIKGVSHPLEVYRPISTRLESERSPALETSDYRVPLIGREKEFESLKIAMTDLSQGRGGIVTLSGEAGLGKSFLVTRLRQHFVRQEALLAEMGQSTPSAILSFRTRCRSYDRSRPFAMWITLLHGWLGVEQAASEEHIQQKLREDSQSLWGDRLNDYYPYLCRFLGLPVESPYSDKVRYLDAEQLRQQFFWTLRSWVDAMVQRGPLMLLVADLQWADTTSIQLMEYCLPLVDTAALLFILVLRPDRTAPSWEFIHRIETDYPHRLTDLELSPLTDAQSNMLIDAILGPSVLPEETRRLLVETSGGNPYYIQELVRSLFESGVLVQDHETQSVKLERPISSLDLPGSLMRLVRARIDRLPTETRHVLQLAAVIGQLFWSDVLQALAGAELPLRDHLILLQRENLIVERNRVPELGMEYYFSSSLLRDAAYDSMLTGPRTSSHARVAVFFEEMVGNETRRQYESLIAYQYRQAGDSHKELFYTLGAAEQARNIYANSEALRHCNRAYELLEQMLAVAVSDNQRYAVHTQMFEVLNMRHRLHGLMGNVEASDDDAEALIPLAHLMGDDPAWLIDALLCQPEVHGFETREHARLGIPMAEQALQLAQKVGDRHRELRSLIALSVLYNAMRDERWRDVSERALDLARELGDLNIEVNLLLGIGSSYGMDDVQSSASYLDAALAVCHKLNDKRTEMRLLSAIGEKYERDGDYYRLLTDYELKRLQISREIGDRLSEGFLLMSCAQVQGLYLGDYEKALKLTHQSVEITQNLTHSLYPRLRLAQLQIALGNLDAAQDNLELARPKAALDVSDIGRAGLGLVESILRNKLGAWSDYEQALAAAQKVTWLAGEKLVSRQYALAANCQMCQSYLGLAGLEMDDEKRKSFYRQALGASLQAYEIYQQFGFVQIIECSSEEVLYFYSRALAANDQCDESVRQAEAAYCEMMRKHDLIPLDNLYRQTYLNIALHRSIQAGMKEVVECQRSSESSKRASSSELLP